MFDFTKEVILNDLSAVMAKEGALTIDGMTYKTENMTEVVKTAAVEGVNATITLTVATLSALIEGTHAQVVIELGLDKAYYGDWASALYYFRRPVVVDLAKADFTIDTLVAAFKKAIPANEKFLTVSSNAEAGTITLTATDNHITINKVDLVDYVCGANGCDDYMETEVVRASKNDAGIAVTDNVVEFGTYNYLIQNHRLPTYANLRFASPASAEMPVKGGEYTQYAFEYNVERRIGGVSVVGQKNTSTTMHVFYVLDATAFEAKLTTAGATLA